MRDPMASQNQIDQWFMDDVLPHEAALTGYLRRNWRDQDEVADLRQDVYVRLYRAAAKRFPVNTRSFVFAVARNLLVDRARRGRVVFIDTVADIDTLAVDWEEPTIETKLSSRQELRALNSAIQSLPARCRDVFILRKVDGLSQREVATRLGIAEGTVEKQIRKGIRRLADALYGEGMPYAENRNWRGRISREINK